MPIARKSSSKSAISKLKELGGKLDLDSPATAEAFRLAAEAYTRTATRTKEAAVRTLQREGILTRSGKLTKRYS